MDKKSMQYDVFAKYKYNKGKNWHVALESKLKLLN